MLSSYFWRLLAATGRNNNMSTIDALRGAAAALLTTAPEPVVRRTLAMLLAEDTETPAPVARAVPLPHRPSVVKREPPAATTASDWPELQQQVRGALKARGLTYAQIAEELGYSVKTITNALGSSTPSSLVAAKLTAWLTETSAPEVAPGVAPFRPNGHDRSDAAGEPGTAS
jgi:DNA-binding NarL/FixJ family response regulator